MKKINLLVEGGWKAFEFESEEFKNQLDLNRIHIGDRVSLGNR
jgi:hypothetical protein